MNKAGAVDLIIQLRIRYVQVLATLLVVSGSVGLVAAAFSSNSNGLVATCGTLIVGLILLWLVRQGRVDIASLFMTAVFLIMSLTISSSIFPLMATFALVSTAVLSPDWVYALVNTLIFGKMAYDIVQIVQAYTGDGVSNQAFQQVILMITLGIMSFTIRYFTGKTREAAQALRSRAGLLEAAAEIGQIIGKLLKLDEVLPRAVELIRQRFDFYHVQVFVIDESSRNAHLVASTGEIGQKLLRREHSLPVGSQSVIGQAGASGKAVLARDTDPIYRPNELLPLTRAELGLPIFDGDKIIAVLDVQSQSYDALSIEVTQALLVLTNLLATSIRNARLFEAQEASARESKRLFLEAESSLREVQRLNQQLNQSAWSTYLKQPRRSNGITVADDEIVHDADWSEASRKAGQVQHIVSEIRDGHRVVAVPMMLGDQVVGAIEVEADSEYQDGEIADLLNAVSQRLALSLDKARLFEESQEATIREQQINQIVARYQTVSNVDDLLRITVRELSQSFGATRAAIRLGSVPVAHSNGDGHT